MHTDSACGAGSDRQVARLDRVALWLVVRLPLIGQSPRNSGFAKLGGLLATEEKIHQIPLEK